MKRDEHDPMDSPRYAEIATFMRAPLASSAEGLDIAMIGVPFDGAVTNRPGARLGPREIRNQSSNMRKIHPVTRRNPYERAKIADLGDVRLSEVYDLPSVVRDIEAFYRQVVDAGAKPLTAGGDHSITYPILRAVGAEQPVGLIQIDSHTDTWDEFLGSPLHHGAPFRRATEAGVIDPKRTVQIGIRGPQNFTDGWDYCEETGMTVIFMHEVDDLTLPGVIEKARQVVGSGPTYVTFDIDGVDPTYAPGTGTPEAGGFTSRESLALLRGLQGLDIVGADVVEVAPPLDPSGATALLAATVMYELLCLMT